MFLKGIAPLEDEVEAKMKEVVSLLIGRESVSSSSYMAHRVSELPFPCNHQENCSENRFYLIQRDLAWGLE